MGEQVVMIFVQGLMQGPEQQAISLLQERIAAVAAYALALHNAGSRQYCVAAVKCK